VIEPNEQKPIGIVQSWSLRQAAAEHVDLLPEDQVFCAQLGSRPHERSQNANNQSEQLNHLITRLPRSFYASTSNRIFGTHRYKAAISKEAIAAKPRTNAP
jgi:hypothetical protein